MSEANFWQDKINSKNIIKEKKLYEGLLNTHKVSIEKLSDLDDLSELALEEENQTVQKEILQNIKDLRILVKKNEIKCFLSNEADSLDCYIEIHAGAGGTESQDWAEMLRRMYLKWAELKNFKSNLINTYKESIQKLDDLSDLSELAIEEKNQTVQKEILQNIKDIRVLVKKNEIKCFLSNEADSLDCYIEIHAGAGGTESQDWA